MHDGPGMMEQSHRNRDVWYGQWDACLYERHPTECFMTAPGNSPAPR